MNWLIKTFSSSIGQKVMMALTGLFLCLFLVVHLSGNLQLLLDDKGYHFNAYAKFMTSFTPIKVVSYVTYLFILVHAFKGIWLAFQNSAARKKGYKKFNGAANSPWASRSMGLLGTIILVFLATHMYQFWYQYKFTKTVENQEYLVYQTAKGEDKVVSMTELDSMEAERNRAIEKYQLLNDEAGFRNDTVNKRIEAFQAELGEAQQKGNLKLIALKDLYSTVNLAFKEPWIVLLYVLAMGALGFHLWHGFKSAFQTMGWRHPKYDGVINALTWFFGIIIPIGFAIIPIYMYFS
ncbi:MAG TPA: succinate dehydrogenase [Bacteroidetes bacterium]|nr:succinate dehydrogenase [Bacteroidota bacterium]